MSSKKNNKYGSRGIRRARRHGSGPEGRHKNKYELGPDGSRPKRADIKPEGDGNQGRRK